MFGYLLIFKLFNSIALGYVTTINYEKEQCVNIRIQHVNGLTLNDAKVKRGINFTERASHVVLSFFFF